MRGVYGLDITGMVPLGDFLTKHNAEFLDVEKPDLEQVPPEKVIIAKHTVGWYKDVAFIISSNKILNRYLNCIGDRTRSYYLLDKQAVIENSIWDGHSELI